MVFDHSLVDVLGKYLSGIQGGMESVPRWEKYVAMGATPENDLQHTFTASQLAVYVIESLSCDNDMDRYLVLKSVLLHDLGEVTTRDTHYIDKDGSQDLAEIAAFVEQISIFPYDIRQNYLKGFLLQFVSERARIDRTSLGHLPEVQRVLDELLVTHYVEGLMFEAIERYGYILYAYREYIQRNDIAILLQVLRHQHPALCALAEELPGFADRFYPETLMRGVDDFLVRYQGEYAENKA